MAGRNSLVSVVPALFVDIFDIKKGDTLIWELETDSKELKIYKKEGDETNE